tara:strand:- start:3704 stop:5617 length:1914 start_codon:yes stop_codon:yes gene_type:complete
MRFYLCLFLSLTLFYVKAQKNEFQSLVLDNLLVDNANAVIRLDATRIEIANPKNLKHIHKRVVTILNKKGSSHSDLHVYYDDKINIRNLGAIVYDKFGNEIKKFKNGDFKDIAAVSSFSLYEDSRIKYLNYIPTEYPYTIEFNYETTTANSAWIPFWRPLNGYQISTEKSTYDIVYDSSVGVIKKEKFFNGYNIKDQSKEGNLSYVAENLKAVVSEELSPDFRDLSPVLMVAPKNFYYEGYTGETGNWESLGKWLYDNLLTGRNDLSEETKREVRNLVLGIDDPIEKARKIYTYVQENTRYISVQVGIGGIRPIAASEVDRVKYGDCKGLTNYTKALLEAVGVQSNYTEVYATSSKQINMDKDFASLLGQANHVILNIPIENKGSVWLECTSQTMPFGFLGDFTDNRDVFVITPEGGKIIRTPKYSALENSQATQAELSVFGDRSIEVSAKIVSKGIQYNNKFHIEKEEKRVQDKYYKNRWDYVGDIEIKDMKFENDREKLNFTESVSFKAVNFSSHAGDRILLTPNVLNRNTYTPNRYRNRKLPLQIERGFIDTDEYEINLPKGYTVDFIPENVSLENIFGRYTVKIERVTNVKLKYMRMFEVSGGSYPKEEYENYRNFIREVSKNDNAKIVLIKE